MGIVISGLENPGNLKRYPLGQAVISNPRVPERIRQALDVEDMIAFVCVLPEHAVSTP